MESDRIPPISVEDPRVLDLVAAAATVAAQTRTKPGEAAVVVEARHLLRLRLALDAAGIDWEG